MNYDQEFPMSDDVQTTVTRTAYGVYKDYDGHSPDTDVLVWCATEEMAKSMCQIMRRLNDENKSGEQEVVFEDGLRVDLSNIGFAHSDGHEWCSSYQVKTRRVSESEIMTSLGAALVTAIETWNEDDIKFPGDER